MLLNKAKMKHRDPKLFYLTMEVGVRKSGKLLRRVIPHLLDLRDLCGISANLTQSKKGHSTKIEKQLKLAGVYNMLIVRVTWWPSSS